MPSKAQKGGAVAVALALAATAVAQFEGKSNDPYRDIVGVATVCYGETKVAYLSFTNPHPLSRCHSC